MISGIPIKGAGATSAFVAVIEGQLQLKGTFIDLHKEVMGAKMPIRIFLFSFGLTLVLLFIRWWNGQVIRFIADYKKRLTSQYAVRLLPRLLLGIVVLAIGYAGGALVLAKLVQYVVEPVYTFPEWIPSILVAWREIEKSFWSIWQNQAGMIKLRSPQLLLIEFYRMVIGWGTAGFALFGLTAVLTKRIKQLKEKIKS